MAMGKCGTAVVGIVALQLLQLAAACFENYVHTSEGGLLLQSGARKLLAPAAAKSNSTHPHVELENGFNYAASGDDWDTGECMAGARQSPIDIPAALIVRDETAASASSQAAEKSTFDFGMGDDVYVVNNGRTILVEWLPSKKAPVTASVVVNGSSLLGKFDDSTASGKKQKRITLTPKQFHFHASSEHTLNGETFPLEAHIVSIIPQSALPSCPDTGCIVVVGVLFKLSEDPIKNAFLDDFFGQLPHTVEAKPLPKYKLNLNQLLPEKRSYFTYPGSLTTPGCAEGVLWHVLDTPVPISAKQVVQFENALAAVVNPCELGMDAKVTPGGCTVSGARTNNRPIQPINARPIQHFR